MRKNQYAVVTTHSFTEKTECVLFEDYERAKAYLHWLWEDYYNEEIANASVLIEEECYHEDEYAIVTWADGCKTEFALAEVYEAKEDFQNINWKRYL